MIDYGQRETDAVIGRMDRMVADIYRQTEEELQKKLGDYLARFKVKDAIKREMLRKGEITLEEYNYWRTGQIMIGKRWEEMRNTIAQDLHNANNIARSTIYGYMPEVYALNHNYATFQVEKGSMLDTSYTLYDRQTVERIMRSNPDLLPPPGPRKKAEIAAGKDIKWQSRQLQSAMTKSILAGDSIPHIAKRLSNELSVTNRKAAERYARTAATGAQNAGRVDAYERAQGMGIEMEQEWLATLDGRTRHEHRYLDGQHVPVGKPFTVDGYELRFPGDPAGPGYLIWNCRCTLVPRLKNLDQSDAPRKSKLGDMNYEEWKNTEEVYSEGRNHTLQDGEDGYRVYKRLWGDGSFLQDNEDALGYRWFDNITQDERDVIQQYRNSSVAINGQLRSGEVNTSTANKIRKLEHAIDQSEVKVPFVCQREANSKLLGINGQATVEQIRSMIGLTATDMGFMSCDPTSRDNYRFHGGRGMGTSDNDRVIYHIRIPTGKGIGGLAGKSDRTVPEFILNRGSSFRVVGAYESDGNIHCNLEYIGRVVDPIVIKKRK